MASPNNDCHIGANTVGHKAANDFVPTRTSLSPETPCCLESTLCSLALGPQSKATVPTDSGSGWAFEGGWKQRVFRFILCCVYKCVCVCVWSELVL